MKLSTVFVPCFCLLVTVAPSSQYAGQWQSYNKVPETGNNYLQQQQQQQQQYYNNNPYQTGVNNGGYNPYNQYNNQLGSNRCNPCYPSMEQGQQWCRRDYTCNVQPVNCNLVCGQPLNGRCDYTFRCVPYSASQQVVGSLLLTAAMTSALVTIF